MKQYILLVTAAVLLGVGRPAGAQSTQHLSLQQAIHAAQQNSPAAEAAQLRFSSAQWQHQAFEAQYLPSLSIVGSVPGLDRSINEVTQPSGAVEYRSQNQLYSSARLMVSQRLPWTGTQLNVSSRLNRIDVFQESNPFHQWNAAPVSVSIDQPIFQFNSMKWDRQLEPLSHEVDRRRYVEDRAAIASAVTDLFFAAYIAEVNKETAAFNVATNDTIYTLSRQRYEIGKIAENDLLQSELQLLNAQNDLSSAEIEAERAMRDLKREVGLPRGVTITLVPPASAPEMTLDPEQAVAEARQHRPAFSSLKLQELTAERNLDQAERQNGFSATISASYGLNQQDYHLWGAYMNPLNQQRFGIQFEVPIFRWSGGKAEVEAARAARQQTAIEAEMQREELDQEVYFEALELQQLRRQVAIAAKADTVAARRFEVARKRYQIGKIDITDLFNAQREKDAAQQDYYQRLRQFWTSYYRLRRMTLYDFVEDRPLRSNPSSHAAP